MILDTFLLLPVIFSAASARFHIQELKPSSENVQEVERYSDALSLLRNLVSALKSKPLENEELIKIEDPNSGPVNTSRLENGEIRPSKLVPVRSVRPVKVYSEELVQLSNLVPDKFSTFNEESAEIKLSNLVPNKFSTSNEKSAEIQSTNLVPVRSLRPVKVYSEKIQPSNLVPDKFSTSNEESAEIQSSNLVPVKNFSPVKVYSENIQPSNLVPVGGLHLVKVDSEEIQPPNLVPVKVSSLKNEETQQSNLVPIRSLHPVKVYSEEIQPLNLIPVKEWEETLPSDLIPVNSLRGDVLANKETVCETDKFYFQICADTCKRAVHQACRNYNCDSEYTIKDACEQRCQWRYPSLSK